MFGNYANSVKPNNRYGFNDGNNKNTQTISLNELAKMFKEHNVSMKMLSYLELSTFARLISQSKDMTDITFDRFVKFFTQVAVYIYSKPPYLLAYMTPAQLVEKLIDHFKEAAKAHNEHTHLYDNPYATSLADTEVLQQLTNLIQNDPNFIVPEGYKKIEQRKLADCYVLRENAGITEDHKICLELLDEILFNSIGIHAIEPLTGEYTIPRVVPVINKPKLDNSPRRHIREKSKEGRDLSANPSSAHTVAHSQHHSYKPTSGKTRSLTKLRGTLEIVSSKYTPAMKLALACAPKEERENIREVSDVLSEIIEAVERGRSYIKQGKLLTFANNKAIKEKEEKKLELEMLKKISEDKRRQRAEMLKKMVEEGKAAKERKKQEEEEKISREKEIKKLKQIKEKQKWEETKKRIIEEKTKKQEEKLQMGEEALKILEEEKKKKLEETKALKAKMNEEYKKKIKQIEQKNIEEKQKEESKKISEKQKYEITRKKAIETMQKEKELREQALKQKEILAEFVKTPAILTILAKYRRPLQHVFKYFAKQENFSIDEGMSKSLNFMNYTKFSKLCSVFKIVPELMSTEDMQYIYRQCTVKAGNKGKTVEISQKDKPAGDTQSVDFEVFL